MQRATHEVELSHGRPESTSTRSFVSLTRNNSRHVVGFNHQITKNGYVNAKKHKRNVDSEVMGVKKQHHLRLVTLYELQSV